MTNPRAESDHFLHQAIVVGDIDVVSKYLAGGGTPNVLDRYDCEPLYTAVKYDRLEIAEMLLTAGGDIFRRSRLRGNPFGAACWNWNARMIDFCIGAGVDVNGLHQSRTILDELEVQKKFFTRGSLSEWEGADGRMWQETYDKLVALGARHASEL